MATETTSAPVNGNYAPHHNIAEATFPAHSTSSNPPSYTAAQSSSSTQPASGKGAADIPQDEVGWYFVEQYYTTLSRSPEKLFLFYNKRSQFVSGIEEEKVSVCIGQKSINERIKELDFQDCKVRITNVDSQGSDDNIVIQVIGEISNKHAPHRKFVQTFVLAGQTNGYFVLNDIFRYIQDEEPELEGEDVQPEPEATSAYHEPVPTTTNTEPKGLTSADDQAAQEADATKVDKELEEVIKSDKVGTAIAVPAPREVNGTPVPEAAEVEEAEDAPVAAVGAAQEAPAAPEAAEEVKEPEKPKEADSKKAVPTPKASPAPPAVPVAAPKPAAPKTWASLAASANRIATPVVPAAAQSSASQQKSTSVAPTQAAAPAAAAAAAAPATPTTQQPPREPSPANSGSEGWQTAGHDHSKRQSRTLNQPGAAENNATRAYIKNVYESVDGDVLKKELAKYGEIVYFDISRQKNCAFVDFATLAGFQAAVNANPHTIGENQIYVEERRLRPGGSFPFQRGGMPRGRGDRPVGQGRGGFKQEGARGNFSARGRGGASTPRGRGSSQAA